MNAYKNIQTVLDYVPNNYQKYNRWLIISKRDFDAPIYMENVANYRGMVEEDRLLWKLLWH